jgi:hypothetical protein
MFSTDPDSPRPEAAAPSPRPPRKSWRLTGTWEPTPTPKPVPSFRAGLARLVKGNRTPLSIVGALTAADAVTQATAERKPGEGMGAAALRGAKSGAIYGSVLAGAEPLIKAGLKKLSARGRETRFDEPEKKHHPVLGTIGAATLPAIPQAAVGVGTLVAALGGDSKLAKEDRPVLASLKRTARKQGVNVHQSFSPSSPGFYWNKEEAPVFARAKLDMSLQNVLQPKAARRSKGIGVYSGVRGSLKPGLLAHEVGHATQPRFLRHPLGHMTGKLAPSVAGLYATATGDEQRAKKAAIVGGLAAAPMLASEVDASVRGSRLLRKAGVKGLRSLSPGFGLPTYAAVAAAPYLAYRTKKALGGYRPETRAPQKTSMSSKVPLIQFDLIERATAPITDKKNREQWKDLAVAGSGAASIYSGLKVAQLAHTLKHETTPQIKETTDVLKEAGSKWGKVADDWTNNDVSGNIAKAGRSVTNAATAFTPKKGQIFRRAKSASNAGRKLLGGVGKNGGQGVAAKAAGLFKRGLYRLRGMAFADASPLTEFRNLTREEKDRGDAAKAAATGAAVGVLPGAVLGGHHLPGRPLRKDENTAGKRLVRRTKWPLIQHEGIGTGKGNVAEVHHEGLSDKNAKLHVLPQDKWSKGHVPHVLDETVDISAAQRARAAASPGKDGKARPFKYNLGANNCQTWTESMKTGKKPAFSRQWRQAGKGALKGAGLGALALGGGLLAARKLERSKNDSHLAKTSKFGVQGSGKPSSFLLHPSSLTEFALDAQGRNVSAWDHLTGRKTGYNTSIDASGRRRVDISSPADVDLLGAARSIHGQAKTVTRWADRGTGIVKDTAAHLSGKPREKDAFGRQKKREWEKPWFGRHVKELAATGALISGGLAYRNSPLVKHTVDKMVGHGRDLFNKGAQKLGFKPAPPVVQAAKPFFSKSKAFTVDPPTGKRSTYTRTKDGLKTVKPGDKVRGKLHASVPAPRKPGYTIPADPFPRHMSAVMDRAITAFAATFPSLHHSTTPSFHRFDAQASDAGWDVRDPRGRSARVFAPGSRPRDRREKKWHEKLDNERLLWGAGLLGTAALAAGGAHMATKSFIKSHPEKVGLMVPRVRKSLPRKPKPAPAANVTPFRKPDAAA